MKKLLLNFIVSLFCLLLAVTQVLATEYTEAANDLQVEWVAGDGTDVYNFTGNNVQAIRSERGFATVNITGTGSVVADNCTEHGCPGAYFNGQFADAFAGPVGTTLAQHYPPWYGIRYPSTASNCLITSGAVACTPVLGSEIIANGTFDADTNWIKGTGWSIADGVATSDNSQTATSYFTNDAVIGSGKWILGKAVTIKSAGSGYFNFLTSAGTYIGATLGTANVVNIIKTVATTSPYLSSGADIAGTVDDASIKEVIWSTFLSNITDYKFKTEVKYSADITAADGDIAMIAFKAGDLTAGSEDFCRVGLNKGTGKVELKKVVAGNETTPLSAAVTYVAGATLLVQTDATDTDGTKWEVYYNGSQVGTDQTLNEASLNSAVAGFMATSASTTFDNWKAGKNI